VGEGAPGADSGAAAPDEGVPGRAGSGAAGSGAADSRAAVSGMAAPGAAGSSAAGSGAAGSGAAPDAGPAPASGPAGALAALAGLAAGEHGGLAAAYADLPGLLDGLDAAALSRAGRLLARVDPDEAARRNPGLPTLTVAVTGGGTLGMLLPELAAQFARHGIVGRTVGGDFGGWVTGLTDPASPLRTARPDLTLCVLDAETILDTLPVPWRPEDVEAAAGERLALVETVAAHVTAAGHGTLVLNTLPLPRSYAAQLVDARSRARLGAIWRRANARLLDLAAAHPAVAVIDLDPLLAEGVPAADPRLARYAGAHLSPELLTRYAAEVGHLARHLTGRTKKVLVLDLDDTLWGGAVGETGPDGIEIGDGYRGAAFLAFQRTVRQLGSQGVLLAAVSKNDPEPVAAVLRDHPDMALRDGDFVQVVANWRPKPDNLRALADTLGLATGSFVFVDDNPSERGLVHTELPGVAVVAVDREPALHTERLLRDGWFDVLDITGEDRARPARYREEAARRGFLAGFDSVTDYLAALGTEVRIAPAVPEEIARVSQLTLRTNQFNLTTRRLQPPEVAALAAGPGGLVATVRSRDRFGGHGLVGAVLARREGPVLRIDNLLLSCRVLARGVEDSCLAWLLRRARDSGAEAVLATYRPSPRNHRVADLYPRHGFTPAGQDPDGATHWRHDLTTLPQHPTHVRLVESFEES
jgi:FkbH-like protein